MIGPYYKILPALETLTFFFQSILPSSLVEKWTSHTVSLDHGPWGLWTSPDTFKGIHDRTSLHSLSSTGSKWLWEGSPQAANATSKVHRRPNGWLTSPPFNKFSSFWASRWMSWWDESYEPGHSSSYTCVVRVVVFSNIVSMACWSYVTPGWESVPVFIPPFVRFARNS